MYAEFDKYLAEALVEVEKKAEPFAVEFAKNIGMMKCTTL